MLDRNQALAAALPAAAAGLAISLLFLFLLCRCYSRCQQRKHPLQKLLDGNPSGGSRRGLFHLYSSSSSLYRNPNPKPKSNPGSVIFAVDSRGELAIPFKPFHWIDHPDQVAEAVEHGWESFSFVCNDSAGGDEEGLPELSWEFGEGSDCEQKVRLNPKPNPNPNPNPNHSHNLSPRPSNPGRGLAQDVKTLLPLPGPALGSLSFPQEAYFEVSFATAIAETEVGGGASTGLTSHSSFSENEHAKLISGQIPSESVSTRVARAFEDQTATPTATVSTPLAQISRRILLPTSTARGGRQVFAVGLAALDCTTFRLPGSYPGSVGFHSDGHVYLNGDLYMEEEAAATTNLSFATQSWSRLTPTVGIGFEPASKKVFFTLNGEMVCCLVASGDEFGAPLYPTLAANFCVTATVNFGQNPFEYTPANAQRISDPCFKRRMPVKSTQNGSSLVHEESGDLFSMGRLDPQYLEPSSSVLDYIHNPEPDSDLFEIALDTKS